VRSTEAFRRYAAFPPINLPDRTWPDRTAVAPPRWLSTDLRDGNQALPVPMTPERKLALFNLLVSMGYREIEVGYPVASRDEYDFIRTLIEQDLIPDDVRISVFVQAREDLIRRTVQCLHGARQANVHVYNATCPQFRSLVFGMTRAECKALAVEGTRLMMKYAEQAPNSDGIGFQYSPETFNETELDFSLEVCEAVMDVWQPQAGREIILNFPTTVERCRPNIFADQIEWLDRNLSHREHVCMSIHPHNDRGTGVASAELAMLAGAQRVEGCLFGGGERAGNVCLATLGLNLFTQGVDPGIDFSDIDRVKAVVQECTGTRVPDRFPYAGELVFTAFSGSHQDAINKGFLAAGREARTAGRDVRDLPWRIPYLPVDPEDLGRSYEAIVRINSQSGKGGIAYVLSTWHGLHLPRGLQIEFAHTVQALADAAGAELSPESIHDHFAREYLAPRLRPARTDASAGPIAEPATVTVYADGISGDPQQALVEAALAGAPLGVDVADLHQIGPGGEEADADRAITVYAQCLIGDRTVWGAGVGADLSDALRAAIAVAAARAALPDSTA
jgi:2-isopropylmalate synthase